MHMWQKNCLKPNPTQKRLFFENLDKDIITLPKLKLTTIPKKSVNGTRVMEHFPLTHKKIVGIYSQLMVVHVANLQQN